MKTRITTKNQNSIQIYEAKDERSSASFPEFVAWFARASLRSLVQIANSKITTVKIKRMSAD